MFESWSRSWEFAKLSYRTLVDNKHLVVFPIFSTAAAILVFLSFLLPLAQTGQLDGWLNAIGDEATTQEENIAIYITAFLFYFCNYFVIVFFNTALVASVMNILEDGKGTIGFGLSFAMKRIHSILGWALVSAIIGMLLKAIERNRKIGAFVSAILGSAWTALTYFVIPVIVSDGVGPVDAFKRSTKTLKATWGTALTGNFSMGFFGFLASIPVFIIAFFLFSAAGLALALAITVPLFLLLASVTSAADMIFKAYLYAYATGRTLPDNIDTDSMSVAFSTTG
ncbi:MAG: DUF6159 family protein [Verrucomicrobiota bacterium]